MIGDSDSWGALPALHPAGGPIAAARRVQERGPEVHAGRSATFAMQQFVEILGCHCVGDLMRRRYVTIAPDETLEAISELMRFARVRHLPVVSEGVLVGLLSYRDVIEAAFDRLLASSREAQGALQEVVAHQLMRRATQTAQVHELLRDAAMRMLASRLGCLPVVEPTSLGPKLVGLLTESDLLRAAYVPGAAPAPA